MNNFQNLKEQQANSSAENKEVEMRDLCEDEIFDSDYLFSDITYSEYSSLEEERYENCEEEEEEEEEYYSDDDCYDYGHDYVEYYGRGDYDCDVDEDDDYYDYSRSCLDDDYYDEPVCDYREDEDCNSSSSYYDCDSDDGLPY